MSLDVGMLDLYVLGAPLLASLFPALLAAVSYIWYKRKKVWFIFLSQAVVIRSRAAWQLSLDSPDCILVSILFLDPPLCCPCPFLSQLNPPKINNSLRITAPPLSLALPCPYPSLVFLIWLSSVLLLMQFLGHCWNRKSHSPECPQKIPSLWSSTIFYKSS